MDMFKKAKSKVQATVKEVSKVAEQQQKKYTSGQQVYYQHHGQSQNPTQGQQYGYPQQIQYQVQPMNEQSQPQSDYGSPPYGQQPGQPQSYFIPSTQGAPQIPQQNVYNPPAPQNQVYPPPSQPSHYSSTQQNLPYSTTQHQQYTASPLQQPYVASSQPIPSLPVQPIAYNAGQYVSSPPPIPGNHPNVNLAQETQTSTSQPSFPPQSYQSAENSSHSPPPKTTSSPDQYIQQPPVPPTNSPPPKETFQPQFELVHRPAPDPMTQNLPREQPNSSPLNTSRPRRKLDQCTDGEGELGVSTQFYQFAPHILAPSTILNPDYDYVCEFCFRTKISPYPALIPSFTPVPKEPWPANNPSPPVFYNKYACSLRLPTAQSILYKSCIPSNSVQPLVHFTQNAKTFVVCSGEWIPSGQSYYATDRISNFGLCIPCFETYVRGTSFEREFKQKRDATGSNWACDLGLSSFIDRWLRTNLKGPNADFERFVSEATQKINLAPCPGELVAIAEVGSGDMYHYGPTEELGGVYCESCYFDILKGTSLGLELGHRYLIEDQYKGNLTCELAPPYSKVVMGVAVAKGDAGIWRNIMSKLHEVTPCKKAQGVNEGIDQLEGDLFEWHALTEYPKVEVCAHCYWTTVKLNDADHLFSPIRRPLKPDFIRQCYLSGPRSDSEDATADVSNSRNFQFTIAWRGKLLRNALSYGYDSKGNFDSFLYTAKTLSVMPSPCAHQLRGFASRSERKFFGRFAENPDDPDDCTIIMCEECHWDCVKPNSPIMSRFVDISERVYAEYPAAVGVWCQTYSKLSKTKLTEAAKTGDFKSFARHWNKRAEVKKRYDPWPARVSYFTMCKHQLLIKEALNFNVQKTRGSIEAALMKMRITVRW